MTLLILWTLQLVLTGGLALWCISTGRTLLAVANAIMFLIGLRGWIMAYSLLKERNL